MLGVFDSGFGGLTILRGIREACPDLAITYLGDSARAPYGDRSAAIITRYTQECCAFLFARGCTLIILACNTASAGTLRMLQQEWLPSLTFPDGKPRNILGVIRPLAEEAAAMTRTRRIAVLGTRRTIASHVYEEEFHSLDPKMSVVAQACPLLVPLIEEGWEGKPETRKILRTYLAPVKAANPDVLILGCTHYEVLHPLVARKMGRRCRVLHSPMVVGMKLRDYLERHPEYASVISRTGETVYLTTGDPERFRAVGSRFGSKRIPAVEQVAVEGV